MTRRRLLLVGGLVVVLAGLGAGALALHRRTTPARCGAAVVTRSAARADHPLLDARKQVQQPDAHRDTLVHAVARWRQPFSGVRSAVGYDYGQWIDFVALAHGIGVRTKDNPGFSLLDPRTSRPRWGVDVRTGRSAWDADQDRYVVLTMPKHGDAEAVMLDQATGRRRWCARVSKRTVPEAVQPATAFTSGGGLLVGVPDRKGGASLRSLDRDGHRGWSRDVTGVADAASVAPLGGGLVLVGGATAVHAYDAAYRAKAAGGDVLTAVHETDGTPAWSFKAPAKSTTQVLNADPASGLATTVRWSASGAGTLVVIDRAGHQRWARTPAPGAFDPAVFGTRVLVRETSRITAYDVRSGRRLWTRPVPRQPQRFPYGFQLAQQPQLDAGAVLLGGTRSVQRLDLRTGRLRSWPLPTDGINTTYWPYQLVATPDALALATNTGAVLIGRR